MITEAEFKAELATFLRNADLPDETRLEVERLQMLMATPGEWEAAKHQAPDAPSDTPLHTSSDSQTGFGYNPGNADQGTQATSAKATANGTADRA